MSTVQQVDPIEFKVTRATLARPVQYRLGWDLQSIADNSARDASAADALFPIPLLRICQEQNGSSRRLTLFRQECGLEIV
ncbi:MAG: hypothetical protein R3C03_12810 [Pirellulaceae bacterium]